MKDKYERIISYGSILSLISFIFYQRLKIIDYFRFGNDPSGCYWLLNITIVRFWMVKKIKIPKYIIKIAKNKKLIVNHNLDENNLQDFDGNIDKMLPRFETEKFKWFLRQRQSSIQSNDENEEKMLKQIFSFVDITI